jgi:hypothetical protein
MTIEIKLLGSNDASALMNVAPGVFDNPIDPRMTNTFLSDPDTTWLSLLMTAWLSVLSPPSTTRIQTNRARNSGSTR